MTINPQKTLLPELIGMSGATDRRDIDRESTIAYAEATNDPNPRYLSGELAPPMFVVVPGGAAMEATSAHVLPPGFGLRCLEVRHDIHYSRPLRPGTSLCTTASVHAIGNRRAGDHFVLRIESSDTDGGLVATQFCTVVVRGLHGSDVAGESVPDHSFPATARTIPVASVTSQVGADQTARYADASGDHLPIHLDDEAARAVGLPGMIVHGFCTMAMCARDVLDSVADGDVTRLRRLAVRFADVVRPAATMTTTIYPGAAPGEFHFEAVADGAIVIKDGLAVIDRAPGK